ncbi:MAG: PqqD family protein [Candidatus Sericytochromatia bacterium]|nr:PqqD family protein [Candidatus Sericytochromatia bacterium]
MGHDHPASLTAEAVLPPLNPRIAARVVNGETLILTPHDSVLHTLNQVGTRVWELLSECGSAREVAARLAEEYEVAQEEAETDVLALLQEFLDKQILQRVA